MCHLALLQYWCCIDAGALCKPALVLSQMDIELMAKRFKTKLNLKKTFKVEESIALSLFITFVDFRLCFHWIYHSVPLGEVRIGSVKDSSPALTLLLIGSSVVMEDCLYGYCLFSLLVHYLFHPHLLSYLVDWMYSAKITEILNTWTTRKDTTKLYDAILFTDW